MIFGAFALAAVFSWVTRFVQNRGPGNNFAGYALFAILAAVMVVPLRWKVRVDQHGISRRIPFRCDLWSWEALASGRVSKLHRFTLHDPERPWWCRGLRLGYMASADIQQVMSMVNAQYKLPPPPNPSIPLTVHKGVWHSAIFDSNGIRLTVRGRHHDYAWHDLRNVHITRMDPLRRDFASLVATLPDQEFELKAGTSPPWHGATAEELNEILFRFAPTDRITVSIAGQPLEKREYIERELRETKKKARELAIMMRVGIPLLVGLLVWMAIDVGLLFAIGIGATLTTYPGLALLFVYWSQRKKVSELRDLLNDKVTTSSSSQVPNTATESGSLAEFPRGPHAR